MRAYPDIPYFTAWNEPNHHTQPYYEDPVGAAKLWRIAQDACRNGRPTWDGGQPRCYVAAGDFHDGKVNLFHGYRGIFTGKNYLVQYKNELGKGPGRTYIHIWAIHAYESAKTTTPTWLDRFLTETANKQVWLTEQNGTVRQPGRDGQILVNTEETQTRRLANLLGFLASRPRIKRFYLYQWTGDASWDSGLLDPNTFCLRDVYFMFRARTNPNAPASHASPACSP